MLLAAAFSSINWLAVLVAGIVHIMVSLVYFQPVFFGKAWVELTGKEMKPAPRYIPFGFAAHLVCVLVLAVIVILANASTLLEGIAVAILVWAGFIVTLEAGELVWEKIPFKLFLIRIGDHLLTLSLAGAILALWR
jgi:hypothetical protein